MRKDCTQEREKVIQINEGAIRDHLGALVRSTVEETLNGLLDAEANRLCHAEKYQRSAARLRHVAGTQWGSKRYLNMDLIRDQDIDKALELAEAV